MLKSMPAYCLECIIILLHFLIDYRILISNYYFYSSWFYNVCNFGPSFFRWPHANRDKRYNEDYKKLYIDVIYAILKEEDPGRPFMASSPSNGIKTEKDGGLSRESPSSTKYGDSKLTEFRFIVRK